LIVCRTVAMLHYRPIMFQTHQARPGEELHVVRGTMGNTLVRVAEIVA